MEKDELFQKSLEYFLTEIIEEEISGCPNIPIWRGEYFKKLLQDFCSKEEISIVSFVTIDDAKATLSIEEANELIEYLKNNPIINKVVNKTAENVNKSGDVR